MCSQCQLLGPLNRNLHSSPANYSFGVYSGDHSVASGLAYSAPSEAIYAYADPALPFQRDWDIDSCSNEYRDPFSAYAPVYPQGYETAPDHHVNAHTSSTPLSIQSHKSCHYSGQYLPLIVGNDFQPHSTGRDASMVMPSNFWNYNHEAGAKHQLSPSISPFNVSEQSSTRYEGSRPVSQVETGSNASVNFLTHDPLDNMSDPNNAQAPEIKSTKPSCIACQVCKKTFKRKSDMRRHAQTHGTNKHLHQCGVKGCGYEGHHRMDKVCSHMKNCHSGGNDNQGVIWTNRRQRGYSSLKPQYCFPGCGDCLLSPEFLAYQAFSRSQKTWEQQSMLWVKRRKSVYRSLKDLLSEDGMGLKKLTEIDFNNAR